MKTKQKTEGEKSEAAQQKELRFEQALERLEAIVGEMEAGDLELETMIARFEEGRRHLKLCAAKLNEVERRIEILVKKDGEVTLESFEDTSGDDLVPSPPPSGSVDPGRKKASPDEAGEVELPF